MSDVKELSRLTSCSLFKIRAPIWNGKRRIVGLDQRRITAHNAIEFTYRRKSDGELSMPDTYYFDGRKMQELDFDRQVRGGTTLILVPFTELQILKRV